MEFCEIVEKTISLEMINILVSGTEHLGASFSHIYSEGWLLRIFQIHFSEFAVIRGLLMELSSNGIVF